MCIHNSVKKKKNFLLENSIVTFFVSLTIAPLSELLKIKQNSVKKKQRSNFCP